MVIVSHLHTSGASKTDQKSEANRIQRQDDWATDGWATGRLGAKDFWATRAGRFWRQHCATNDG